MLPYFPYLIIDIGEGSLHVIRGAVLVEVAAVLIWTQIQILIVCFSHRAAFVMPRGEEIDNTICTLGGAVRY